jgi:hypothetical protein
MHPATYISGRTALGLALPRKSSAMPPDVRKAFGLPASAPFGFLGYAHTNRNGSAERFRTSGGIAESREALLKAKTLGLDSARDVISVDSNGDWGQACDLRFSVTRHCCIVE